MKRKIVISSVVAFVVPSLLGPPDAIAQLTFGVAAALPCAVLLWLLSRSAFVKSSPPPMHTLVCILVCLVAMLSVGCYMLGATARQRKQDIVMLWNELDGARGHADGSAASPAVEGP